MDFIKIIDIKERAQLIGEAAAWFNDKWKVPREAYIESMNDSLNNDSGVPAWYLALDENDKIVAGLGVIHNDFHKRPDLTPNVCAVYVSPQFRQKGLARKLLNRACEDLAKKGVGDVYLITSHTDFYEKCGWHFYDMIEENDGHMIRCYHRKPDSPYLNAIGAER